MRRLVALFAALLLGLVATCLHPVPFAAADGYGYDVAAHTYDGPSVARIDNRDAEATDGASKLRRNAQDQAASPSVEARRTSTTPSPAVVATNTGSRGLSNLGGIIEETGTNAAGGRIFTSSGAINQNDFAGIVESSLMKGDQVSILTGAHGLPNGALIADASMFADDVAAFGKMPGVSVHNVASMSPAEISAVLQRPGTIIGGFCDSGACLSPYRGG